ncbi:MAG: sulfatase/phosphatase domain-containing protein, partial [Planctomycetota bacterium]
IVFFWTDHGISHIRGKQFLYDEGIRVPLIVWGPGLGKGVVREDLVEQIDIAASSLALVGLDVPDHLQSRSLFDANYEKRECVFSARDRCDETVERLRCVRTGRYKYIRNFYWHVPHAQANRYKDGKEIMKVMRRLFAEGKLDENQARPFAATRPVEELYDLKADPHELDNLAEDRKYAGVLRKLRGRLNQWIEETRDIGQLPEPIIADYLKRYETPYSILEDRGNRRAAKRINEVWELAQGGKGAIKGLVKAMGDKRPQVRYAAAFWLGNIAEDQAGARDVLVLGLNDKADYVRIASARALCLIDERVNSGALAVLVKELQTSDNEVVRHYAAEALEDMGPKANGVLPTIKNARGQKYEYVKRVTTRIVSKLESD